MQYWFPVDVQILGASLNSQQSVTFGSGCLLYHVPIRGWKSNLHTPVFADFAVVIRLRSRVLHARMRTGHCARGSGSSAARWRVRQSCCRREFLLSRGHEQRTGEFRIEGLLRFLPRGRDAKGFADATPMWRLRRFTTYY